jgi:hypothetical protein
MSKEKNQIVEKKKDGIIAIIDTTEISKSNCKFCQSKNRKEAENKFEESGSIKAAANFLREKGDEISYLAVRNHLHRHYLGSDRLQGIKDWAEETVQFRYADSGRKSHLMERIAILRREMCIIASSADSCDMDERRKNADIVKRLSDGISSLEDKISEIDGQKKLVDTIIDSLKDILSVKISKASNEETKNVLMEILEELSDSLADVMIEDKD